MRTRRSYTGAISVAEKIRERAEAERSEARLLIALGVPFALLGWLGLAGSIWLLQLLLVMFLPWSLLTAFWIAAALALVAIVVDCLVHPVEEWRQAEYYLTDGTVGDAIYGRMPLMTSMTDPHNWVERGRVVAGGCSNVVLAGPRNIRRGLAKLALARAMTRTSCVSGTEAFVAWLREHGPATETQIEEMLKSNSRQRQGAALALKLGLVWRRGDTISVT